MTTAQHERSAIRAMYAGLGLTVVALIVAYVDHATPNVLAGHLRAGYPAYAPARIDSAVTTYLVPFMRPRGRPSRRRDAASRRI